MKSTQAMIVEKTKHHTEVRPGDVSCDFCKRPDSALIYDLHSKKYMCGMCLMEPFYPGLWRDEDG